MILEAVNLKKKEKKGREGGEREIERLRGEWKLHEYVIQFRNTV